MANIHIERSHDLGLSGARKIAWKWAEQAESDFDMQCAYEEGEDCDQVHFNRTGAKGTLRVTADQFELDAQLGFLLGAFKDRIESEIVKNLDGLLAKNNKPVAKKATAPRRK